MKILNAQDARNFASCLLPASEKFENGGFTLKTHQMLSVHTTMEEQFKNATITV